MKQKPVFKNTTKGRIQVIQQGIPIWLNPGDVIVGERFRIYTKMGLEEVGREGMPKPAAPAPAVQAVNDPEPEKAPVKLREMRVVDHVIPVDEVKVEPVPAPEPEPEPEFEEDLEPDEVDILPMDPPEDGEVELALHLVEGETLKEEIIADILDGLDDEDDIVVIEDDDDIELEEPDDYPFKCEVEGCGRAFASQRGLKSHSRVHSEE